MNIFQWNLGFDILKIFTIREILFENYSSLDGLSL